MSVVKPCPPKGHAQLALEWDRLADERHRQIASGNDLSFEHVLVPMSLELLEGADKTLLLDVGSGTGDLTNVLAANATRVFGVEPSAVSVDVSRQTCAGTTNVQFMQAPLENAQLSFSANQATAAIAAMTLMAAPELRGLANALSIVLKPSAVFVATIAHPCFWPRYWGYDTEPWFDYSSEIFITAPFVISRCRTDFTTTHIHRPLAMYIDSFARAGFTLDWIVEPIPSPDVQALYPEPWRFPRFLGIRWRNRE